MFQIRILFIALTAVPLLGLGACAPGTVGVQPAESKAIDLSALSPRDTDKLFVVDCLLPGQVRKLGQVMTYITPRRPLKTSAIDCEIRGGEYVAYDRADYSTALKVWLPQAKEGKPEAQAYVGEIYEKGLGIQPDYDLAAEWYHMAAEQGYARAQINLGHLYEKGLGVEQDLVEAMTWYRKASGLGGEVEFVSSVELTARAAKEEQLRQQVSLLTQQAGALRKQLRNTQSRLSNAHGEKKTLETGLRELQRRKKLLEQNASGSSPNRDQLEQQLKERRAQLERSRSRVARLQKETQQYRDRLHQLEAAQQLAKPAPRIEIIDPPLALTRTMPAVRLRAPVREREIFGRISAPAGLLTFHVNKRVEDVGKDGTFRVRVPVSATETPVALAAIDKKGRRTVLEFVITPPPVATAASAPISRSALKKTGDIEFGSYYALIIGNDDYAHLPKLKTAVNDARQVDRILREKYGFQTTLLLNADRHSILSALYQLRGRLTAQDNLLIYYAGHGDLDRTNDRGYWLPVNAEPGNPANWISNVAITDMLNTLPAKHVMVVADSCYSGTMSRTAVPRIDVSMPDKLRQKWLRLMAKSRSRTVLTSGSLQPVLDEGGGNSSVFAQAFLAALKNSQDIVEGYSLFRKVAEVVTKRAARLGIEQVPEYAPIKHAGHETGQFFFVPVA